MQRWRLSLVVVVAILAAVPGALASPPPDTVGVVDPGTGIWYLRGADGSTTSFYYGDPGDTPFLGDWDCDGIASPGLYRRSDGFVYLRNSNTQGVADVRFFFGNPDDVPLAGDFDGDGCDTVSLHRPVEARFYVIDRLGSGDAGLGAADREFPFGNPTDAAVAGDFDADGRDEVGVVRDGVAYIDRDLDGGAADIALGVGSGRPVAGDLDQAAGDEPITYGATGVFAPAGVRYGNGALVPVIGPTGVGGGTDPAPPNNTDCTVDDGAAPAGTTTVAPGSSAVFGSGTVRTFTVETEDGEDFDPACVGAVVESVLSDGRSWIRNGAVGFQRVGGQADFRIIVASPATTDRWCLPLNTAGTLSCRNGNRIILNSTRWRTGAAAYGEDVVNYRRYLVNHEVGHMIGKGHRGCPGAGQPAPVMMQQTKGVGSCVAQPWPLDSEL